MARLSGTAPGVEADAGVFWHAGSVLALPETGIPSQYSRFLEPEEFAGGLTVPIASHVHRQAADGGRVLFGVDDGSDEDGARVEDGEGIFLRIGEWDAAGCCAPPSRWSWNGPPGNTTSGSRPRTWCSLSRRRHP